MFEHKSAKVIPVKHYLRRQARYLLYGFLVVLFSLVLGMMGYHYIADLSWVDALLNASMILTGMGPINPMTTDSAKIFASVYSLYSGIVFLTTIAVMSAPALHRLMHILHLEKGKDF
ncbi:MAG: hypothetical protein ACKOXB_12715 [Flavobacteriales bacterium]